MAGPVKFVQTDEVELEDFVQADATWSAKTMQTSATDSTEVMQISVRTSGEVRGKRRARTRRRRKRRRMFVNITGFFGLTSIESEDDEEVHAGEAEQEVVEITVDSGAAKIV